MDCENITGFSVSCLESLDLWPFIGGASLFHSSVDVSLSVYLKQVCIMESDTVLFMWGRTICYLTKNLENMVCVHTCMQEHAHVCTAVCEGQKCMLPHLLSTLILRQGLSLNLGLAH